VQARLGDELRIVVSSERSQLANREEALRRLASRLEAASKRPRVRRPTRPSRGAVEERLSDKRRTAQRKSSRRLPSEE
jgi:ribosome-associated protein